MRKQDQKQKRVEWMNYILDNALQRLDYLRNYELHKHLQRKNRPIKKSNVKS
jgi:hypothetical protein